MRLQPEASVCDSISGLASRIHTVHKYNYPPSAATTAVHHLIDLYLAKGHLAAACRWFLRAEKSSASARRNAAFCVCVCVPPCTKGSHSLPDVIQEGASMTHRVQRGYGHGWEGKADHLPVPAPQHTDSTGPPCCCVLFPWRFRFLPPKPFHRFHEQSC